MSRSFRLCVVGDSFVLGTGDEAFLGWPGRLCAAARRQDTEVTLHNLGVRRDTSGDVLARWPGEAAARLPHGIDGRLIFSFGANDCSPAADGDGPRIPHARSLANARLILEEARRRFPTLMIGPLPVGDDPETDERIAKLCPDLAALCASLDIPYLAGFETIRSCPAWTHAAAAGDGTHPGAGGYAALAALVERWPAWSAWLAADPADLTAPAG